MDKVEIYDLVGRVIQSHKVENNQLKIGDLPSGKYFIKIFTSGKTYFSKIVKR